MAKTAELARKRAILRSDNHNSKAKFGGMGERDSEDDLLSTQPPSGQRSAAGCRISPMNGGVFCHRRRFVLL